MKDNKSGIDLCNINPLLLPMALGLSMADQYCRGVADMLKIDSMKFVIEANLDTGFSQTETTMAKSSTDAALDYFEGTHHPISSIEAVIVKKFNQLRVFPANGNVICFPDGAD